MSRTRNTPLYRKELVGIDNLLNFDANRQHYVDCGVNLNINSVVDYNKSFAISFFFVPQRQIISTDAYLISHSQPAGPFPYDRSGIRVVLTTFGNHFKVGVGRGNNADKMRGVVTNSIKVDKLHHAAINYKPSDQSIDIYINGVYSSNPGYSPHYNIPGSFYNDISLKGLVFGLQPVGMYSSSATNTNGMINHVSFFNRNLTEIEIKSIHNLGGVLPNSTHANCVAHYIADREGWTMWDTVQQYNYAKPKITIPLQTFETTDVPTEFTIQHATVQVDTTENALEFTANAGATHPGFRLVNSVMAGFRYRIAYRIKNLTSNIIAIRHSFAGLGSSYLYLNPGEWGSVDTSGVAGSFSTDFYLYRESFGIASAPVATGDKYLLDDFRFEPEILTLQPHHAELVNFTATEVGLSNLAAQTAYKDIYSKQNKMDRLLKFDSSRLQYAESVTSNFSFSIDQFSVSCVAYATDVTSNQSLWQIIGSNASSNRFHLNFYNGKLVLTTIISGYVLQANFEPTVLPNRVYYITLTLNAATDTATLCLNGVVYQQTILIASFSAFTFNNFTIGTNYTKNGAFLKGGIGRLIVYNRALTDQEAKELYYNEGLPQSSLHPNIIAHYEPNTNGLEMTDLIQQYNYAKPHIMQDFSTNIEFDNSANYILYAVTVAHDAENQAMRITSTRDLYEFGLLFQPMFIAGFTYRLRFKITSLTDKPCRYVYYIGPANLTLSNNTTYGQELVMDRIVDAHTVNRNFSIRRQPILDGSPSNLETGDSFNLDYLEIYAIDFDRNAYNASLINYTEQEIRLLEQRTLLPQLRRALKLDGYNQYVRTIQPFTATGELGYTMLVSFEFNTKTGFRNNQGLLTSRNGGNYMLIHGGNRAGELEIWHSGKVTEIDPIYTNHTGINQVVMTIGKLNSSNQRETIIYVNGIERYRALRNPVTFDQINTNLHFGMDNNNYLKGHIAMAGVAKGVATVGQVKELWNNSQLSQPKKNWTNLDWQILPNFGRLIDNTTNVEGQILVEDLSGKNVAIEAINYNASSADSSSPGFAFTPLIDIFKIPEYSVTDAIATTPEYALTFERDLSQRATIMDFIPTGELGYSLNVAFAYNQNENFSNYGGIFGKRVSSSNLFFVLVTEGNSKRIRLYSGAGSIFTDLQHYDVSKLMMVTFVIGQSLVSVDIYVNGEFSKTSTITLTSLDKIVAPTYIGFENGHYFDGKIAQLGFAKGMMNEHQVRYLWNNGQLASPLSTWTNLDWQLLPNFNSVVDTAGAYSLQDDSGKGFAMPLQNFTATHLDPQDPAYALVPITSLQ